MTKVRLIKDVADTHPDFKPKWNFLNERSERAHYRFRDFNDMTDGIENIIERSQITTFSNENFGEVEHIVICKDNGKPLYDQYQITEGPKTKNNGRKPGAIIVPYIKPPYNSNNLYIGLLQRYREVPIDNLTGAQGRVSFELPRGFANLSDESPKKTAKRELGEETGKLTKSLVKLGEINPNTTFYVTSPSVYAAEIDDSIANRFKKDAEEPILKCKFLRYEVIKEKIKGREIFCGMTLGALAMFDAYLAIEKCWK